MTELLNNYSINSLLVILVFLLIIVVIGLLIALLRSIARTHEITYPIYDYVVKKAEDKAHTITYDAMEKSRDMLVNAELQGTKVIAKGKLENKKIEEEYEKQLVDLVKETESLFGKFSAKAQEEVRNTEKALEQYAKSAEANVQNTQKMLDSYATNMENRLEKLATTFENTMSKDVTENEKTMKEEAEKMSEHMRKTFAVLEEQFKKQIEQNITKEFSSAKNVINEYKKQQTDLIDSYIVALVERTTAIALHKELSLGEHTKLIQNALEEAKSKGVFT